MQKVTGMNTGTQPPMQRKRRQGEIERKRELGWGRVQGQDIISKRLSL